MEAEYKGFSIREYTSNVRSVDIRKCCPFPGDFTGDFIQSLLPPIIVTKFRWWSHESSPCKKRSIDETTTNDPVLHKKKIKTKKLDDSFDAKTDNKVCMQLESMQLNKSQPVVSDSERRLLSHARAESGLSCFPGPHLTLERIKDALDLERKRHVAQPIQSSISILSESHYRSSSSTLTQPVSLLNQSPFDPLLVEETISRRGEKIIASDPSLDYSFLESYPQQSWLWQTTTLEESHSITSPQGRTYLVPDSELPPTLLYPCGSLVSCPLTDKDLYFHESGLGQQLNSVTFCQEQLPFPYEIAGLPSDDYRNVGVGLPFTSTTQSQLHWPENSFESSRLGMSFISPAELN